MKLYRTQHHDTPPTDSSSNSLNLRYHWQGTLSDAATCRKKLRADSYEDIETTEVEVPTSKAELLTWLNANVVGE